MENATILSYPRSSRWLASIAAPGWMIFALVAVSMVTYGAATAAAVYFTPWGERTPAQ